MLHLYYSLERSEATDELLQQNVHYIGSRVWSRHSPLALQHQPDISCSAAPRAAMHVNARQFTSTVVHARNLENAGVRLHVGVNSRIHAKTGVNSRIHAKTGVNARIHAHAGVDARIHAKTGVDANSFG